MKPHETERYQIIMFSWFKNKICTDHGSTTFVKFTKGYSDTFRVPVEHQGSALSHDDGLLDRSQKKYTLGNDFVGDDVLHSHTKLKLET